MDINYTGMASSGSAGMFFDTDLTNAYGGAEIRYQADMLRNSKLVPYANEHIDVPLVFNDPDANETAYYNEWTHYEASVIDVDVDTITIRVRLTSSVFELAETEVTLDGTEAYFGPCAWLGGPRFPHQQEYPPGTSQRYILHDNLTYTPAPEPSSLALLGITGMLLVRRRRLQ